MLSRLPFQTRWSLFFLTLLFLPLKRASKAACRGLLRQPAGGEISDAIANNTIRRIEVETRANYGAHVISLWSELNRVATGQMPYEQVEFKNLMEALRASLLVGEALPFGNRTGVVSVLP